VSFSRRTVPSVYEAFVDVDGSEIEQDLRLRVVPLALTVRVLPLGQTPSGAAVISAAVSVSSTGGTPSLASSSTGRASSSGSSKWRLAASWAPSLWEAFAFLARA
jgi:hypothetical protein